MRRTRITKRILALTLGLLTGLAFGGVVLGQNEEPPEFTDDYRIERCTFSNEGRNAYFSVEPGDFLQLEGEDVEDDESVVVLITVLDRTRTIRFTTESGHRVRVKARVVEEREYIDDVLVEVSRNYYARCRQTNDVFYFGEDVDFYDEDGEITGHAGSWLAGQAGALPGVIMPGSFLLGSRYYQEIAPDVALDRAEHTAMGLEGDVPAGPFEDCVEVIETTPLEPGHESRKVYCPGVGLVVDEPVELVDFDIDEDDDEDDD